MTGVHAALGSGEGNRLWKVSGPDTTCAENWGQWEFVGPRVPWQCKQISHHKEPWGKLRWKKILQVTVVWSQRLLPLRQKTHKTSWVGVYNSVKKCISFYKLILVWEAGVFLGYLAPVCIVSERRNNLYAPVWAVKLRAKCLQRSPGTAILHVVPKRPINYLLTYFEYSQLQEVGPCIKPLRYSI